MSWFRDGLLVGSIIAVGTVVFGFMLRILAELIKIGFTAGGVW